MARHRRHRTSPLVHWLRVSAVAAGVGAAVGTGTAIASAAPSETADAGTHADAGQAAKTPHGPATRPGPRQRQREARAAIADIVSRVGNREARVRRSHEDAKIPRNVRTKLTVVRATVLPRRPTSPAITRPVPTAGEASVPGVPSVPDVPAFPSVRPLAAVVADLPAPQTMTRSVISPVWSRLGSAGAGTPSPAVPVGDIVAAIRVAVREAGGQRASGPVTNRVVSAASPSGSAPSLDDVAGRPGVTASVNDDGTVHVISGTFTDTKVEDADDAAQVLNNMSGLVGAPAGFADPENITVQQVDTAGGYSRTIYRVHHSVDGVDVTGSDVVLVTDSDGNVTGLFNDYDARADVMDTTPDRRVDTETEAAATALAAYAGTPNTPLYLFAAAPLVAAGVVKPELIIDATDDTAGPQLVWKVSVDPPDVDLTGARTVNPGATYYISASGAEAGAVTRATSNAQPLAIGSPTSTTADDVLGNSREFGITRLSLLIFDLDSLNDVERDISTYETVYLLLFVGPPQTPGIPVFRGLLGWDASAVSAHANMATVYDYYATQLGVTSFDDDGAPIVVSTDYNPHETFADYTDGYQNAFWDSSGQQFAFGDSGDFEAAIDIVGHEYTHAVMEHQGGTLDYGESGALNEAYADIMGVLIEGKARDDEGRWLIGEDSSAGAIRSLADPESTPGYLSDYDDLYTGEADEGGEHYNSTIFSHAAYRMMTDERTAEVTDEQWAELYYVSMTMLDDGAKFSDGRDAIVATAHDQVFSDDEIAAIEDAFDDVHIDAGGTVVSV
ncbi:M4 family metallopeptidase [Mycobacterium sp. 48b]|uniref:M4 family metallopeptidase n=1 Tax=Mycobacterium sp. 48b TaxID=3400426 RepID=UPI003AAC1543